MGLLTPDFGLFFWTLVAFLCVFFILRKFAWKPILQTLHERETNISDSIASAERVKAEMGQLKAENEKLLTDARAERAAMLKEAKDEQERMLAEAKEKTRAVTDRMMAEAQQQIQQQKNAALNEVKNEIGKLAVDVAEKILRKQLSNEESQAAYSSLLAEEIKMN